MHSQIHVKIYVYSVHIQIRIHHIHLGDRCSKVRLFRRAMMYLWKINISTFLVRTHHREVRLVPVQKRQEAEKPDHCVVVRCAVK